MEISGRHVVVRKYIVDSLNKVRGIILRDLSVPTLTDGMLDRAIALTSHELIDVWKVMGQPPSLLDRFPNIFTKLRNETIRTTV